MKGNIVSVDLSIAVIAIFEAVLEVLSYVRLEYANDFTAMLQRTAVSKSDQAIKSPVNIGLQGSLSVWLRLLGSNQRPND